MRWGLGHLLRCHVIWALGWDGDSRGCVGIQIRDSTVGGITQ